MSENLTKLAHKVDFSKDESEEKGKATSEGDKEEEEESAAAIQPALWPWDSVWNKLKYAFRVQTNVICSCFLMTFVLIA